MIEKLASSSVPVVAAHRGYKAAYPENTLLSFQKALELGIGMIEFDLRLTKDKVLAVIHDEQLDRTTDGTGAVGGYTWEEIRQMDAGGWFGPEFKGLQVPRLEELCELLKAFPGVLLNVEIKPAQDAIEAADRAIALLKAYGLLANCVFTSFDADVTAHLHDTYGLRTQGFAGEAMTNFVHGEKGTYSKMWSVALPMSRLTDEAVKSFREKGLLVWCYCPDTEEQVKQALACGVSLMTCNDPLPAMRLLRGDTAPGV